MTVRLHPALYEQNLEIGNTDVQSKPSSSSEQPKRWSSRVALCASHRRRGSSSHSERLVSLLWERGTPSNLSVVDRNMPEYLFDLYPPIILVDCLQSRSAFIMVKPFTGLVNVVVHPSVGTADSLLGCQLGAMWLYARYPCPCFCSADASFVRTSR